MKKYINSISGIALALLLISFVTFSLMNFSADDPIAMKMQALGANVDPALIEQLREETGLNRPFLVRYFDWLGQVLQGNLGQSIFFGAPVEELMGEALPKTVILVLVAAILSALISLPASLYASLHHNSVSDYFIRILSMIGISLPSFWMALLLMYVFALELQWLSVTNNEGVEGIILPALTLAIWVSGLYIRRLRASFLEELGKDYIVGARALGLSDKKIILSYLVPNGILFILPMLGITIGILLGGATIIETIFGWRGIGYLMVQAIISRDYPLMQGYILWTASIYIAINCLMDFLIAKLVPSSLLCKGGADE